MTEITESAKALEYSSSTLGVTRTIVFKSKDGETVNVVLSVSASHGVSDGFWESIQEKFADLQKEATRIFQ